jgi:hypothetical protein
MTSGVDGGAWLARCARFCESRGVKFPPATRPARVDARGLWFESSSIHLKSLLAM